MSQIKLGKYKHYKGKMYEVIGLATHSETLEELVVYKMLYNKGKYKKGSLWVRPRKMFFEKVNVGGKQVQRFKFVREK